jgi:N-methylhydantoinase A
VPTSACEGPALVGVDVGGTFTDLAAIVDGRIISAKVPSTPGDQSVGVMRALEAAGLDGVAVGVLSHGMTVATNALLERCGARTALVTTEGFRDVIEIGRQARPSLYNLTLSAPAPLVPRELRFTVRERMGPNGPITALDRPSLEAMLEQLRAVEVDAVAVCLLFSFLHPEHEREVGAAIRAALPGLHLSLSSEVLPEMREYERFATTVADAYLAPHLRHYLDRLAERVQARGLPAPHVMQSSGGVVSLASASQQAATCVLSGPAAGVVGAAHAASTDGYPNVLTFDMGGTSTDVASIVDGTVQTATGVVVAGVHLGHPMVDVHTVSAGGGSIAWVDAGGALRVGPRSAGAEPGPVCYDRGGGEPTVTDANLVLGYLGDGSRLGGEVMLRRDLAYAALERLGVAADLDPVRAALGVVEVANAEILRALRVISVERGLDPRDFALVAFGGAGAMHACAVAESLEMSTVLVPRAGGVLSAFGLAACDERRDFVAPLVAALDDLDAGALDAAFASLEARALRALEGAELRRFADLRYRSQSFELTVPIEAGVPLRGLFDEAHRNERGYEMPEESVWILNIRVVALRRRERPALVEGRPPAQAPTPQRRTAYFDGRWQEIGVHDRMHLGAGDRLRGPAIVEFPEATCVVASGWLGRIETSGTLILERA